MISGLQAQGFPRAEMIPQGSNLFLFVTLTPAHLGTSSAANFARLRASIPPSQDPERHAEKGPVPTSL